MSSPKPGEPGFVPPGGITCQECTEFLLEYIDRTLPASQRDAFDRHTEGCAACEMYLKNYRRVKEMASGAGDVAKAGPVPASLVAAILSARKKG